MKRKVVSALLAISLITGTGVQAFADPITEAQQQQINENRQKYAEVNSKIQDLTDKIDALDDQIQPLIGKIDNNNKQIKDTKTKIAATEKEIDKAKIEIDEKSKVFGERMRAIYKSGGDESYIAVLLGATSISDLISRVQAVGKIMSIDKKIISELNEKKAELDNNVKELQAKNEELEKLNAETQAQLEQLNKKKEEQLALVSQLKEEQKKVSGDLAESERALIEYPVSIVKDSSSSIDELRNAVNMLSNARSNVVSSVVDKEITSYISKAKNRIEALKAAQATPNRGVANGNASDVISYAYQFLGTPYVWGATGPNSFDCSGFVSYVYRRFGVNLPRTTYDQINVGEPVSYSDLKPGDLVFTRGTASRPEHVGIYVGGGQMIHAPRPGEGVKVGSIYSYVAARRLK